MACGSPSSAAASKASPCWERASLWAAGPKAGEAARASANARASLAKPPWLRKGANQCSVKGSSAAEAEALAALALAPGEAATRAIAHMASVRTMTRPRVAEGVPGAASASAAALSPAAGAMSGRRIVGEVAGQGEGQGGREAAAAGCVPQLIAT